MDEPKDNRRTWSARAIAAGALLALIILSTFGYAIVTALGSREIAERTGLTQRAGQLEVVRERPKGPMVFEDLFVYSLRTAAGQVSPPALPLTFPIYPGAVAERSAVFRDETRVLRGVVYSVPANATTALAWYRTALETRGYWIAPTSVSGDPDAIQARRGKSLVRVNLGAGAGSRAPVAVGVYVSGQ